MHKKCHVGIADSLSKKCAQSPLVAQHLLWIFEVRRLWEKMPALRKPFILCGFFSLFIFCHIEPFCGEY